MFTQEQIDELAKTISPVALLYGCWSSSQGEWFTPMPEFADKLEDIYQRESYYPDFILHRQRTGIGIGGVQFKVEKLDLELQSNSRSRFEPKIRLKRSRPKS